MLTIPLNLTAAQAITWARARGMVACIPFPAGRQLPPAAAFTPGAIPRGWRQLAEQSK